MPDEVARLAGRPRRAGRSPSDSTRRLRTSRPPTAGWSGSTPESMIATVTPRPAGVAERHLTIHRPERAVAPKAERGRRSRTRRSRPAGTGRVIAAAVRPAACDRPRRGVRCAPGARRARRRPARGRPGRRPAGGRSDRPAARPDRRAARRSMTSVTRASTSRRASRPTPSALGDRDARTAREQFAAPRDRAGWPGRRPSSRPPSAWRPRRRPGRTAGRRADRATP